MMVARLFQNLGKKVSGLIKRHLFTELIESGISIHFEDDIQSRFFT
jgi:hypothetical protein